MSENQQLAKKLKVWRLESSEVYKSIEADRKRLSVVKKILDTFIPFLSEYTTKLSIGYEIDGEEDHYTSVIFRDLNLDSDNIRLMHFRISQSHIGEYSYLMEYSANGVHFSAKSTPLINIGKKFSDLKNSVADKFREFGVYTEDESIVKDIIT